MPHEYYAESTIFKILPQERYPTFSLDLIEPQVGYKMNFIEHKRSLIPFLTTFAGKVGDD